MLGFAAELGFACQQSWPEYDESKTVASEITLAVQVGGKLRGSITVPADADNDAIVAAALADEKVRRFTDGMTLVKSIVVPGRLVNLIVKPQSN